jgi:hypothetical protein
MSKYQKHHRHHSRGPKHNVGNVHRGHHWCYDHNWRGYTQRVRHAGVYYYWVPDAGCWYRFDGQVFYPVPTFKNSCCPGGY